MAFTTFTTGRIKASEVNANFALCIRTDSVKTISVTHIFTPIQTFTGGVSIGVSKLTSPADGVLTVTDAGGTTFTRMQFGGTTASYPALARSAADLQARLADNSDLAHFYAESLVAGGTVKSVSAGEVSIGGTTQTTIGANGGASALTANPVGYIIINVAGTNRIIPYYTA